MSNEGLLTSRLKAMLARLVGETAIPKKSQESLFQRNLLPIRPMQWPSCFVAGRSLTPPRRLALPGRQLAMAAQHHGVHGELSERSCRAGVPSSGPACNAGERHCRHDPRALAQSTDLAAVSGRVQGALAFDRRFARGHPSRKVRRSRERAETGSKRRQAAQRHRLTGRLDIVEGRAGSGAAPGQASASSGKRRRSSSTAHQSWALPSSCQRPNRKLPLSEQ